MVRMASDRSRPPPDRYNYRNCFQALWRIYKDEGVLALYRGWVPNVVSTSCRNVGLAR